VRTSLLLISSEKHAAQHPESCAKRPLWITNQLCHLAKGAWRRTSRDRHRPMRPFTFRRSGPGCLDLCFRHH